MKQMKKKQTKATDATKEIKIVEEDISVPSRFPDASSLCRTGLKAGDPPDGGSCPY
jgi:hypothetical protein